MSEPVKRLDIVDHELHTTLKKQLTKHHPKSRDTEISLQGEHNLVRGDVQRYKLKSRGKYDSVDKASLGKAARLHKGSSKGRTRQLQDVLLGNERREGKRMSM